MITKTEYDQALQTVKQYRQQQKKPNDRVKLSRKRPDVYLRIIRAKQMRDQKYSLTEIGNQIGVDHSTIIYYLKRFDDLTMYGDFKELMK